MIVHRFAYIERVKAGGAMRDRFPFGYIFLAGLVAGIFMMNFGKNILLDNTGLLDENTLRQVSALTLDSGVLFVFILRKRMTEFGVLALAATTYLGIAACVCAAGWYGFCVGAFLTAGVLRYGIKGILLAFAATLPQYLLYGPALYGLLLWCAKTCRMIYGRGHYQEDGKIPVLSGRVFSLLLLLAVTIAGCALESFINPVIFKAFVRIL